MYGQAASLSGAGCAKNIANSGQVASLFLVYPIVGGAVVIIWYVCYNKGIDMTLESRLHTARLLQSADDQRRLAAAQERDGKLLQELFAKVNTKFGSGQPGDLANHARLEQVQASLEAKGTLTIPIARH